MTGLCPAIVALMKLHATTCVRLALRRGSWKEMKTKRFHAAHALDMLCKCHERMSDYSWIICLSALASSDSQKSAASTDPAEWPSY
jgi:hypothetical protein